MHVQTKSDIFKIHKLITGNEMTKEDLLDYALCFKVLNDK